MLKKKNLKQKDEKKENLKKFTKNTRSRYFYTFLQSDMLKETKCENKSRRGKFTCAPETTPAAALHTHIHKHSLKCKQQFHVVVVAAVV